MTDHNPYTPDEEDVRTIYSDHTVRWIDGQTPYRAEREFDRFLAQVRRDAWQEGAQAQADTYGGQIDTGPNPYRETGGQR